MYELARYRGTDWPPPKGTWVPAKDEREGCIYTCPICGITAGLGLRDVIIPALNIRSTHRVQDNGEVKPSVICNGDDDKIKCTFHHFVKLLDWGKP